MGTLFPLGIHKHLMDLGLNETQVRILESIFELKNPSTKDLEFKTTLPKSTIIYSLNRLKELHLINSHRDGLKEYYHVQSSEHLEQVLQRRAQEEINIIHGKYEHIKHFWQESTAPKAIPHLRVYQGNENIIPIYQDILENMEKQVILINGNSFNCPQALTRTDIHTLILQPQLPFERQLFLYKNRLACIENQHQQFVGYVLENSEVANIIQKLIIELI